jgi:hypothetical protein
MSLNPFRRGSIVLVLGMHRSGTSALTRILSLAGARLPRTLFEAVKGDNDRGYWESRRLIERHEALFERLGTTMLAGEPVDPAWFRSRDAALEEAAIARIVHEEWSGGFGRTSRCWVIKEPRICRLMPLWRGVLARTGRRIAAAHPLREPAQVAASLARRDGMPRDQAERAWLEHVLSAERWSRDMPRTFTTFDGLLDDWRGTVARVAALLPRGHLDALRAQESVEKFLAPELRHHRVAPSPVCPVIADVRDELLACAHDARAPDEAILERAWSRTFETR